MKRNLALLAIGLIASLALSACSSPSATDAQRSADANGVAPTSAAPTDTPAKASDLLADASTAPADATPADDSATPAPAKLIVGLDDTFAPMGFRDTSNALVGFDIDLANAVGAEMGLTVEFQPIDWDAKEMELSTGKIDCIWNGMSRNPEREASMTLSQNYLENRLIIMTSPDVTITDKAQLADYKVGTQAGSSALDVVKADAIFPSIEANLSEYPTYDECLMDLQAGRIQVMIVDEVLGKYKNSNLETKLNISDVDFGIDYYVIGFRKDDTELCARVEAALQSLIASGKAKEISMKWFGEDKILNIK